MSADDYEQLHTLLGKAIEEDASVKSDDETSWYVLMAAQRIAFARMFALRYESPVPVPQSLRAPRENESPLRRAARLGMSGAELLAEIRGADDYDPPAQSLRA